MRLYEVPIYCEIERHTQGRNGHSPFDAVAGSGFAFLQWNFMMGGEQAGHSTALHIVRAESLERISVR